MMMIVRATITATDLSQARVKSGSLCGLLGSWGTCKLLKLERYYKDPREFIVYIEVSSPGSGDRRDLLRTVAHALASGRWQFHDSNPDESRASWDSRMGGAAAVATVTWLGLELLPSDMGTPGRSHATGDGPLQPPQV
jgi:hypothetical protein